MKKFLAGFAKISLIFAIIFSFGCNHNSNNNETPKPDTTEKNIIISKVKVAGKDCQENAEIEVDSVEADVEVTFAEAYAGLTVKIGGQDATLDTTKRIAKGKVTGLTATFKDVKIEAKATGKTDKTFNFKVKKGIPIANINELVFEGKEINPSGSEAEKDQKVYSNDSNHPPLLTDIKSDGTTKVGDAKLPTVNVKVRYKTGAQEQKLKVENATTGKSEEKNTAIAGNINLNIALKGGDNNLTITYSEKDKRPLVYKVIVGYVEPEYKPIDLIKFNNEWYSTEKKFQALEAGGETLTVEGVAEVTVKVQMPKLWYDEDGWQLTLDGKEIEKTEFVEGGYSAKYYTVEKKVALTVGATKEVKIIFKNATRNYDKTYKISITHKALNKIDSVILINPKGNKHLDTTNGNFFKANATKGYYKARDVVIVQDRIDKSTFLITPQDATIAPKYIFENTDKAISELGTPTWQGMTKKAVTYTNNDSPVNVNTYVIENHALNHGSVFLYILLEKDSVKTYYMLEIKREQIPATNAEKADEERIYQDESGTKVDDNSPVAKKGLIRVLPKSPRVKKVKLLTPEAKDFTLNATDGWYECTISLDKREVSYTYEIMAEDNTAKKEYKENDQKFLKSVVIKDFKFDYKKDGQTWNRKNIEEVDDNYYLVFDKKEVKENKLHLFITGYKGLEVECADFLEPHKEDTYSDTNYDCNMDVSSFMTGTDTKKEYTVNLKLAGKLVTTLKLTVYLKDDVIESIYLGYIACKQMSDSKYLCKGDINSTAGRKIEVNLYLLEGEVPANETTNRKIKLLIGGEEKAVTITKTEKSKLQFATTDKITITQGQKIDVTIEYYADKTQSSPTRTYTLNIEDI